MAPIAMAYYFEFMMSYRVIEFLSTEKVIR